MGSGSRRFRVLTVFRVTGSTSEEARKELLEALEGWITVHTRDGNNPLPEIDGITPRGSLEDIVRIVDEWEVSQKDRESN